MKVYCPFGLFESTGAFETKSKWLSKCIDNLHFIPLPCLEISIPMRKKKYPRKNSSQHTQSSSGNSSYTKCKIYTKILLLFPSSLLYVGDTITQHHCSISCTVKSIREDNTHLWYYRNGLCVNQIIINKGAQSQRSCAFLHCWHPKASSN